MNETDREKPITVLILGASSLGTTALVDYLNIKMGREIVVLDRLDSNNPYDPLYGVNEKDFNLPDIDKLRNFPHMDELFGAEESIYALTARRSHESRAKINQNREHGWYRKFDKRNLYRK
jgi:hypothetical protein